MFLLAKIIADFIYYTGLILPLVIIYITWQNLGVFGNILAFIALFVLFCWIIPYANGIARKESIALYEYTKRNKQ